jgi:tRNA (guanine-N7-)-methyltransferase
MRTSPNTPQDMDWTTHFPAFTTIDEKSGKRVTTKDVEVADIGCGFGGLVVALSTVFPDTLMLGSSPPLTFSYQMLTAI